MNVYQIKTDNYEFHTSSHLCFFIETEEGTTQYVGNGTYITGRQWVINDYGYCMNLIYRR